MTPENCTTSSFNPPTLDELPVDAFPDKPETIAEESDSTFEEVYAADKQTVAARKKGSAFTASFNAVMLRSGVIRAGNELKLDPNEIMRLYFTLIDAAQRTEYLAESSGAPCSKLRRFKCGMYMIELFYKRTTLPRDLNEEERKRVIDTLSRMARKRWKKVHAVQRHLHLGFFVREKGEAASNKKTAGHFIDHLTDLLADTARRAAELKGEPIGRYNRAADEALAHFRASVAPYAPEWEPTPETTEEERAVPSAAEAPSTAASAQPPTTEDKWKPIRSGLKKCMRAALQIVREDGLSEAEAFARRQEMHFLIETEWADAPEPTDPPEGKAARAVSPSLPPVIVNADSAKNDSVSAPPESDLDRTPESYLDSEETANLLGKTQILSAENSAFSGLPEDQAMLTAEPLESVGCDKFKTVFQGIYPLVGEAVRLGSEPAQKGSSLTASASVAASSEGDLDRTPESYLDSEETANSLGKTQILSAENSAFSEDRATRNLTPTEQAMLAAEAFSSVGCDKFKTVFLGIYPLAGEAVRLGSEPAQKGSSLTAAEFKVRIPEYLRRNRESHHNIVVRVWGAIIQIDDCNAEILERLKPFAFYAEETSPGNFQVWIALPKSFTGIDGKLSEAGKALRQRLLKKFAENGETANGGAYGSTRLPGTLNIKEKYQPTFPLILLTHVALGRIVTPEELEQAGLLAAAPVRPVSTVAESPRYSNSKLPTTWPDYQYYVSRAPLKEDGQPNLSRADESFVVRCFALGHSRYSIAEKLRSVRDKTARRDDYVERTLNAAESYLASQPQTSHAGARQRMVI